MPRQQQLSLYRTCSLPDKEQFFISRLEDYLQATPDLFFPHAHSFYQVAYFSAGSGTYSIDFKSFPVDRSFYFMVPGQVHTWNFDPGIRGYLLHFRAGFIKEFIRADNYLDQFVFFSGFVRDQVIRTDSGTPCEILFEDLYAAKGSNPDLLRVLLLRLLVSVSNREPAPSKIKEKHQKLLNRFKKLINETVKDHKLPAGYAKSLGVNLQYLNTVCRKELDQTPGEIIRDRVITEAKRLMINNKITMTEISQQLHFPDNSYFTKFFRKYNGVTPEKFRKNINQDFV